MNLLALIKAELKAIFTNQAIVLTIIGGSVLYSFLYPQPYINQVPRKQKIVFIDQDNSHLSHKIARLVNASANVSIVRQVHEIKEAQELIESSQVMGYLLVPKDFAKNVELRKSPSLVYGGNASYFLVYGSIAEVIFKVSKQLNEDLGIKPQIDLNVRSVFNPTLGYINYVIPAVFILILHQVMALGSALQGSAQNEKGDGYWNDFPLWQVYATRLFVYTLLYFPMSLYYMGFCFDHYSIPTLALPSELVLMIFTLIFSATSLGMFLGEIFPRRELATFFILISSMILVFTAGFVWPSYAITPWLYYLVQLVPAIPAILSFVKLNQMGVDFYLIIDQYLQILLLGIAYLSLAILLARKKRAKAN